MKFNVTVDDKALLAHLTRMIENAQDLRKPLEAVGDDFLRMERAAFTTRGASNEHPWQPLTPGWARQKARKGGGGPLHLTGRLERSLTSRNARYSVRRVSKNMITVGTRNPLAHLHQGGTKPRYAKTYKGKPLSKHRYSGVLPARPVVFVTAADQKRWRDLFATHVRAEARGVGL